MVATIYPGFTADEPTTSGRAWVTAIDASTQRSLLGLGYDVADDSAVVHLAGVETISGAKTFSGISRFIASGIKTKWQSYGQDTVYDTTFDGNNLVCNYSTLSFRNNWGSVNISGATGVDLTNVRVTDNAVFKNAAYPLGTAIFRKADGTGVTDGGTAATALVWKHYLDGGDTAAAFSRNDGRFTLQGIFGQRIIFGADRNFNIYSAAGNYLVKTLADSSLAVRNGADSADADLAADRGTFSGTLSSPGGANQSGQRLGASTSVAQYSVAVGKSANASGEASVSVGYQSSSSYKGVTCGYQASAGWQGIAIGRGASTATTYGSGGIAIGRLASSVEGAAAFGHLVSNTTVGTLAIGSASVPLSLNVAYGGGMFSPPSTSTGLLVQAAAGHSVPLVDIKDDLGNSSFTITQPVSQSVSDILTINPGNRLLQGTLLKVNGYMGSSVRLAQSHSPAEGLGLSSPTLVFEGTFQSGSTYRKSATMLYTPTTPDCDCEKH